VEELRGALREAKEAPGLVLASSLPTLFSAGWDLPDLVSRRKEELAEFVDSFCELVREIFVFGGAVVAALPGHAIAGGLIVAAAADERLAAEGDGELGLSEIQLGLPLPAPCLEVLRHALGARGMERLAATGENLTLDRAVAVGLVDRVVAPGQLLDSALARAQELAGKSHVAYAEIKHRARGPALARFDNARQGDPFLKFWESPDAQGRIGALIQRLKKKK
jgi:enoyl-CoA hydratase/carnithine racemase